MNNIIWDKKKNEKLMLERNISFDEISQMRIPEESCHPFRCKPATQSGLTLQ